MNAHRLIAVSILGLLAGITLTFALPAGQEPVGPDEEQALALARQDTARLGQEIRGLLMEEMKRGGLPGAVRACSTLAQQKTSEFLAAIGRPIRRVSLKLRNEANAPDAWERIQLVWFDRLNEQKKLPEEHWEVVEENGSRSLRYLKPIPIQGMCLSCHGPAESIPAEVKQVIRDDYPRDRAIGYKAGDVRGAISVTVPLPDAR
jgi:hypothetical protein